MNAVAKTVMALALVLTGCAALEAPVVVEAEPVEDGMTISFGDGELGFNGQTIAFPAQVEDLVGLLGPPSRNTDKGKILHTWDELGIVAYEDSTDPTRISALAICYTAWSADFAPSMPFRGVVECPVGTITANSTPEDLQVLGFRGDIFPAGSGYFRIRHGDIHVAVKFDDGLARVSLFWREFPRERSKPVPSPDDPEPPLFNASRPHRGGTWWFRELRRDGRVSVTTYGADAFGGAVGFVMFVKDSMFEMTSQRPFPYFVVLEHEIEGEPELVIGYLDTDQPDVATLFPDYYDRRREYVALSTDPVLGPAQAMDHPDAGL